MLALGSALDNQDMADQESRACGPPAEPGTLPLSMSGRAQTPRRRRAAMIALSMAFATLPSCGDSDESGNVDAAQSGADGGDRDGAPPVDGSTIDATPADSGAPLAYFCVSDAVDDRFVLRLEDPEKIATARSMVAGTSLFMHVGGMTGGPQDWNPYWSFHMLPDTVYFFEAQIEICDAAICWVHQNGPPRGQWCPWTSDLEYEILDEDFASCVGSPRC